MSSITDHGRPGAIAGPDAEHPAQSARAPSHAERCRTLAERARAATLCTQARDPAGYPYGSLVTVAVDAHGRPLLLLSALAEHTGNLKARAEASLLLAEPAEGRADPLALGRMTLIGPCRPLEGAEAAAARTRFLAAHPRASYYVDFTDFSFYRLDPVSIRYVGGFGRMSWVEAAEYAAAEPDPLASDAARILEHMNADHSDAVLAYAKALAGIRDATGATMTSVDRYGFELDVITPAGPKAARLAFAAPVTTTDEVRKAMVALVREARGRSA
ncbi:HugZ family protein [Sorangium sp. So ce406]|uniref:HugZ family pyridoxamine 5'-phosphate oxidase n=1 Tax=Sorangium sp. So ce406 TaxID=3133311 RepID=UPI003F5AE02D